MDIIIKRSLVGQKNGQWTWKAVGDNGEIVHTSEHHKRKATCIKSIVSVRRAFTSGEMRYYIHDGKNKFPVSI